MSRGKSKPSIRSLSKGYVHLGDPEHQRELLEGTDRAAALVGCAVLDNALVNVLNTQFIAMDEDQINRIFYNQDAALPSMSSRIKIGLALGVYDDEFAEYLTIIKNVRNAFAHTGPPLTFANALIAAECRKLPDVKIDQRFQHSLSPERDRYTAMCHSLVTMLDQVSLACAGRPMHRWINMGFVTPPASLEAPHELHSPESQTQNDTPHPERPQPEASGE